MSKKLLGLLKHVRCHSCPSYGSSTTELKTDTFHQASDDVITNDTAAVTYSCSVSDVESGENDNFDEI